MKKLLLLIPVSLIVLIACNSDSKPAEEKKEETTAPTTPVVEDVTQNPAYKAGLALIGQSDCLTCHRPAEKLTGPAYQDVANKYASQAPGIIPQLADKIISGGTGVWGQVPMLPHPTVSHEDAEKMVKYILLLKTN